MKINSFKKITSVLLAFSVLAGFTGCTGGNKALIAAAESLAKNMSLADYDALISNSNLDEDSDEAEELEALLDTDAASADAQDFIEAVEATIEYSIDADSCNVKKDKATVDIIFTMVDYNSVLKDDYTDIGALVKAIKKADTKDVKFTAEFVKEGKDWVANNVGSKKFMSFYGYRDAEIKIAMSAEMIAGFIDDSKSGFALTYNNQYYNTPFIQYDFYFDSAVHDYADRNIILHTELDKDGSKLVEGDEFKFGSTTLVTFKLIATDFYSGGREIFEGGKYTVLLLTEDNETVASASVVIQETVVSTTPAPGGGDSDMFEGEGIYFYFLDNTFRSEVIDLEWFDYDDKMTNEITYTSDVNTLAFSIEVDSTCTRQVDYLYAYCNSDDESAILDALQNPDYSNTITPTRYDNGYFYDLDYEVNGQARTGYYVLLITDSATGAFLFYACCVVS